MTARPFLIAVFALAAVSASLSAVRLFAEEETKPPVAPAALTKEEKVRKLLKLNGSEATAKVTLDKILQQFDMIPGLPNGFAAKFKEKAGVKDLVDLNVGIHVKNLDDATLDAAIAFYETAAGKALAAKLPTMSGEFTDAQTEWAQTIGMEVAAELAGDDGK